MFVRLPPNRTASTRRRETGPEGPSSAGEYPRWRRRWKHAGLSRATAAVGQVDRPDEALGTVLGEDHHHGDDRLHRRALVRQSRRRRLPRRQRDHRVCAVSRTNGIVGSAIDDARRWAGTICQRWRRGAGALLLAKSTRPTRVAESPPCIGTAWCLTLGGLSLDGAWAVRAAVKASSPEAAQLHGKQYLLSDRGAPPGRNLAPRRLTH
jgi:hypothetical protein